MNKVFRAARISAVLGVLALAALAVAGPTDDWPAPKPTVVAGDDWPKAVAADASDRSRA